MMNTDHLCMSCMREIGDENQCPYCGFHADSPQLAPYLPLRTVVAERYLAGKLLDYNGDGATYMGWDLEMNAPVTIREFLPDSIAERREDLTLVPMAGCEITYRDCYQSFLELWRKLARMRGLSALILVFDIVEDHGTAYAISEYMEGVSLREYLLRSPSGYLSWEQARILFMPVPISKCSIIFGNMTSPRSATTGNVAICNSRFIVYDHPFAKTCRKYAVCIFLGSSLYNTGAEQSRRAAPVNFTKECVTTKVFVGKAERFQCC